MNQTGTLRKIALILLLLVALPAVFYSVYEANSLSRSEALMATVYRQQLDVVLFSINQYTLDVASNWSSTMTILINEHHRLASPDREKSLRDYLAKNTSIEAGFLCDSLLSWVTIFSSGRNDSAVGISADNILSSLRSNRDKIDRLEQYRRFAYRKLEPVSIVMNDSLRSRVALVFALSEEGTMLAGIIVDKRAFIQELLAPKILEAAGIDFVLAVFRTGDSEPVYASSPVSPEELKQSKGLWLFPDYQIGIRLRGATIDDLVRSRFYRNLGLIVLLDLILLAGVWFVYTSMRKGMDLVRMKTDFVSNVSHELRTPLALIRMYAETLQLGRLKSEEKKQEYYSTIVRESERLTRLVNNILSFSRMEAGKKHYQLNPVDLNAVVTNVLGTYGTHIASEGFTPVIELTPALPAIAADVEAVSEALINIIDNAVKYSDHERYLRIHTGTFDDRAFVDIEDHGIGIAPEHQKKIFDTFYRVSGGLVSAAKGSGLGLTLVKQIMIGHKGEVNVTSTPGKGSTFRLQFPLLHIN